jgi:hypothetical protein
LLAWCRHAAGYPFYGLYNLDEFEKEGLEFKFDDDLRYFSEGTFLHKLFLVGGVKFVPGVYINLNTQSQKPDAFTLLKSFASYSRRTFLIYLKSKIELKKKLGALRIIFDVYSKHASSLLISASRETSGRSLILYSLTNPTVLLLVGPHLPRYAMLRLSSAPH